MGSVFRERDVVRQSSPVYRPPDEIRRLAALRLCSIVFEQRPPQGHTPRLFARDWMQLLVDLADEFSKCLERRTTELPTPMWRGREEDAWIVLAAVNVAVCRTNPLLETARLLCDRDLAAAIRRVQSMPPQHVLPRSFPTDIDWRKDNSPATRMRRLLAACTASYQMRASCSKPPQTTVLSLTYQMRR